MLLTFCVLFWQRRRIKLKRLKIFVFDKIPNKDNNILISKHSPFRPPRCINSEKRRMKRGWYRWYKQRRSRDLPNIHWISGGYPLEGYTNLVLGFTTPPPLISSLFHSLFFGPQNPSKCCFSSANHPPFLLFLIKVICNMHLRVRDIVFCWIWRSHTLSKHRKNRSLNKLCYLWWYYR